jgi:hypothetical protein
LCFGVEREEKKSVQKSAKKNNSGREWQEGKRVGKGGRSGEIV